MKFVPYRPPIISIINNSAEEATHVQPSNNYEGTRIQQEMDRTPTPMVEESSHDQPQDCLETNGATLREKRKPQNRKPPKRKPPKRKSKKRKIHCRSNLDQAWNAFEESQFQLELVGTTPPPPTQQICIISEIYRAPCHPSGIEGLRNLSDLTKDELSAISWKIELGDIRTSSASLCLTHLEELTRITRKPHSKRCCRGYAGIVHKRLYQGQPLTCSYYYGRLQKNSFGIVPGVPMCSRCKLSVVEAIKKQKRKRKKDDDDEWIPKKPVFHDFNKVLDAAGIQPLNPSHLNKDQKKSVSTKKLNEMVVSCVRMLKEDGIEMELSNVFKHTKKDIEIKSSFDIIMGMLKKKYITSHYKGKIQALTMAPPTWTVERIAKFFSTQNVKCPTSQVRIAMKLREASGPLAYPLPRIGNVLPPATVERVISFFNEDTNSRALPGMKDNVGVIVDGIKIRKAKRLLLANLRDIHKLYMDEYGSTHRVGFSKFCSLRPKEILLANSRGIHNVCVCTYHGNVKLMLDAIKMDNTFRGELMDALVCDNFEDGVFVRKDDCMLGTCSICKRPNAEKEEIFKAMVRDQLDAKQISESVKYSQWTATEGRGGLQIITAAPEDFIQALYHQFVILLPHHFVSGSQAASFKLMRSLSFLSTDKAVVQVDFGENFSFIVQDAPQSFHWETSQATIHPFAAWICKDDEVICSLAAVVSDEPRHDTETFYAFQKTFLNWFREEFKHISHIEYWSDGCSAQYKNRKLFDLLLHHVEDFGITASWNFFATSHGKGAVDGVSARMKDSARRHSLRALNEGHILDPKDFYDHCVTALPKMKFFYVTSEDVKAISSQSNLKARFERSVVYPQTKVCHRVVPQGKSNSMFRITRDKTPFYQRPQSNTTDALLELVGEPWLEQTKES